MGTRGRALTPMGTQGTHGVVFASVGLTAGYPYEKVKNAEESLTKPETKYRVLGYCASVKLKTDLKRALETFKIRVPDTN